MLKTRDSKLTQKHSPRLKTSSSASTSSDSHQLHRPITNPSAKLDLDRRSHTDPLTKKKLGGQIFGLDLKLEQAQKELRLLKEHLTQAVDAKKHGQEEVLRKKFKKPIQETDVLASKEDQINVLKARLYDMKKEKVSLGNENEILKNQLKNLELEMSFAKVKESEIASKVSQIEEELEESNETMVCLKKKLESMEEAKESLEIELKVQTEQWKKAADTAAKALSRGSEINDRFSERRGSMEKYFASRFLGSPVMADDSDGGLGTGKMKDLGFKMFGDFWKKKG